MNRGFLLSDDLQARVTRVIAIVLFVPFLGGSVRADPTEITRHYKNLSVNGKLVLAEGKKLADGVVLITHSLIQHNGREPIPHVQELLHEHGYSSLAINYSLEIDNRHGSFDCTAPHRYTLDNSLAEIGSWIHWLKEQGVSKIILLGHSYGGNELARYAVKNNEDIIRGIVLLGPGTADHRMWSPAGYKIRYGIDIKDILERAELLVASGRGEVLMENVDFIFCPKAKVSAASFVSYYRISPERLLPNLLKETRKPTLFIAASEDNRMPDLNRLVKPYVDGKKTQLVVIEDSGHFFLDLNADEAIDEAVRFFRKIGY